MRTIRDVRIEKWQGLGNAYLLVAEDDLPWPLDARRAGLLTDRRRGLGGDGLLVLGASAVADIRMRIVNPDGSASEACGNGTRMVARYAAERNGQAAITIETAAGVLATHVHDDGLVTARLARAVTADATQYRPDGGRFPYPHRFIGVGNPHVVIPVDNPAAFPLEHEGPLLEHHPWFPQRANVEVVRVVDRRTLEMRVWERGVGETDACGSGACAVAVAGVLDGSVESPVTVRLPGGSLEIAVSAELDVDMTGPAERVFTADLDAALLARLA